MATVDSVSPDPMGDMNSIHQDIPPAAPSLDTPISVPDTSFASQLIKPATQSAPYHPVQPTYKQPTAPVPQQQDRTLTELTDKGDAIVKQVISGDTLLIRAQKGLNGPPTEQQITLTMIQAPRLGRRPGPRDTDTFEGTQDEAYAWASREFLRQLIIGELVQYSVEITVKNSKKIAKVMYNNENLSEKIVQAGLAKLREQPSKKGTEEYDRIVQFKEEAESLKLGMYSMVTTDSIRNVQTINQDNSTQFVDKHKGKILDGIVEQVLNGNTLRFCLPATHQHFTAQVTGIRCPSPATGQQSRDDPQDDPELGLRAKYAVEIRLLQRDVKIRFDGINNQIPLVTVLHVRGNIAEYLIQEGFARVMQWSQKHLPDQQTRDKYKQLENAAKQKGVKIWLGAPSLSSSQSYSADKKKYQAKVLEIVSAEQLILKTGDKQDSIQKVFLSSTRGPPRKEFESSRPTRALYDQPFFFEAREFLRKWLVGKRVSVEVDYTRPPQDQYSERTCVTIIASQGAGGGPNDNVKNVSEALIIRGLGLAIRHKGGDDLRSQHLDALIRAEGIAKDEGRGFHAKKMPDNATIKVSELSTDVAKARTFQSSLQRSGRVKAIVEYVTSGNRFRVYIPKEQILISFILTGISCPKGPGGPVQQGQEEPYGIDAINFSKEKVLQHDVNIEIENIDKRGSFIGTLFYEGNKNLAHSLVEEGLAYLHTSAYGALFDTLSAAEREAKRRRIRIWENYDEAQAEDEHISSTRDSRDPEDTTNYVDHQVSDPLSTAREMIVTEVHRPNCLWAQPVTTADTVRDFSAKMKEHFLTSPPTGLITLRRNMKVAAKFMDNEWYRAEIQQVVSQDKFTVHYIDYGNTQTLSPDRIARLPDQYASLPAQAKEFQLFLTVPPQDEEWCKEAQRELLFLTLNKHVFVNTLPKQQTTPNVTCDQALIYTSQDIDSDVSKQLISEGLLLVDNKRRDRRNKQLLEEYQHIQSTAKHNHLNVWQYGDIREDFVPEFGYTPKNKTPDKKEVAAKNPVPPPVKEAPAKKK